MKVWKPDMFVIRRVKKKSSFSKISWNLGASPKTSRPAVVKAVARRTREKTLETFELKKKALLPLAVNKRVTFTGPASLFFLDSASRKYDSSLNIVPRASQKDSVFLPEKMKRTKKIRKKPNPLSTPNESL
jgi:hypothetical protein